MGATICKYFQKLKELVKNCFNCNPDTEQKNVPPYKLKKNDEDEIIESENKNVTIQERKISDFVEENYMSKNNLVSKNNSESKN